MTTIGRVTRLCLVLALGRAAAGADRTLFTFGRSFDLEAVQTSDARVRLLSGALEVVTGTAQHWPGITLRAPDGVWDLTDCRHVTVTLSNPTEDPVKVFCRVDNAGANGKEHCVTASLTLRAGETAPLAVALHGTPWRLSAPLELIGMRGFPTAQTTIDPAQVTQILLFVASPETSYRFRVAGVEAGGDVTTLARETFLPFVDAFGQFAHADWPGKTHDLAELKDQAPAAEAADLAAHPGPAERDRFGGWRAGPRRRATGFFRVEKISGRWWLVDPDGYLFWSLGVDCVHDSTSTPISDREDYFVSLPPEGSALAAFYGSGSWAPHGYYQTHSPYRSYDLFKANLFRKYGPGYAEAFDTLAHRRLRSWGLNTIGNWSDRRIWQRRQTPYTDNASFSAPVIEGSSGYWGRFYDVFDPAFRANCRARFQRVRDTSAGDPWCLGYFVHNEIAWGDELSLALATLQSPASQAAKQTFVDDLRRKYRHVAKLNAVWGTSYADWEALLTGVEAPDREAAYVDLAAFYDRIADTYFRTIRDALKAVAPEQLYLGCRFARVNDRAARAAARYCDVVCYNRYAYSVADLHLPAGADRPILIGEFHFGALDRGMFHTGLRATATQEARAEAYRDYVRGALRNPAIVGAHWFQFKDQALTGRGDGENYQIGFLDVCDRPYPELVSATREIGAQMYRYRMEPAKTTPGD